MPAISQDTIGEFFDGFGLALGLGDRGMCVIGVVDDLLAVADVAPGKFVGGGTVPADPTALVGDVALDFPGAGPGIVAWGGNPGSGIVRLERPENRRRAAFQWDDG